MDDRKRTMKEISAEKRKKNKPIMEKKRRERINICLEKIKLLILEAQEKDVSFKTKKL